MLFIGIIYGKQYFVLSGALYYTTIMSFHFSTIISADLQWSSLNFVYGTSSVGLYALIFSNLLLAFKLLLHSYFCIVNLEPMCATNLSRRKIISAVHKLSFNSVNMNLYKYNCMWNVYNRQCSTLCVTLWITLKVFVRLDRLLYSKMFIYLILK